MPRTARIPVNNAAEVATQLRTAAQRFRIRGQQRNSATCEDMAASVSAYGGWASTAQASYADSLIHRSMEAVESPTVGTTRQVVPAVVQVNREAVARIAALFTTAREHGIQRPAIHVHGLRFTLAPSYSRNAGSIYVTSNARLRSERTYFGRIQEGVFIASPNCTEQTVESILDFGRNPSAVARAHGHATGICCFCRHSLTDARSVAMGYGPICADHYGLPWGEERASSVVELPADFGSPAQQIDTRSLADFGSPAGAILGIDIVRNEDLPETVRETARQVDAALAAEDRASARRLFSSEPSPERLSEAERLLRAARERVEARRREFNRRSAEARQRAIDRQAAQRAREAEERAARERLQRDFLARPTLALPEDDEDHHFL